MSAGCHLLRDRRELALACCGVSALLLAGCSTPQAAPGVVTIPSVTALAPPPPTSGTARKPQPDAIRGVWKEFWGDPETTDVTYHDVYRIDPQADGALRLTVDGAEGTIKKPLFASDELTFTQVTSFDVHYQLRLKPGGRRLEGTAKSPNGVFPIRWEKIADRPDGEVPRDREIDDE